MQIWCRSTISSTWKAAKLQLLEMRRWFVIRMPRNTNHVCHVQPKINTVGQKNGFTAIAASNASNLKTSRIAKNDGNVYTVCSLNLKFMCSQLRTIAIYRLPPSAASLYFFRGQMEGSDWRVHLVPKEGQRFQRVYGQGAQLRAAGQVERWAVTRSH